MKTAVVTDGKYRSSLAAVRALGEAGFRVVVTQTRQEADREPASFLSRFTYAGRWIPGSCKDPDYGDRLTALLKEYDHPVLFPTGADTLRWLSAHRQAAGEAAAFLAPDPQALEDLNDKEVVHRRCLELGLPVPREYTGEPDRYPVVVKPRCGEQYGLKASQRYRVAGDRDAWQQACEAMRPYGGEPIVQEQVTGPGEGANLLLDRESRLVCAFCHRRLREYPVTGGPSTCCVSFYDEERIRDAYRLLASFGFVGMAMVEFKGGKILEVNPRVWGSFPMTACCGSPYVARYAQAALGEPVAYTPRDFREGAKMRYLFHDGAAALGYLRRGQVGKTLSALADFFRVPEALDRKDDRKAYRAYLKNSLRGKLG